MPSLVIGRTFIVASYSLIPTTTIHTNKLQFSCLPGVWHCSIETKKKKQRRNSGSSQKKSFLMEKNSNMMHAKLAMSSSFSL